MTDVTNVGTPQIAKRTFVPWALSQGVEYEIRRIVLERGAVDKLSLLFALVERLEAEKPRLAAALNTQTLDAIIAYIQAKGAARFFEVDKLPETLQESGPAEVKAVRQAGTPNRIDVLFTPAPAGYVTEIYFNDVFVRETDSVNTNPAGLIHEKFFDAPLQAVEVAVLYRDGEGAITPFGPLVTVTEA